MPVNDNFLSSTALCVSFLLANPMGKGVSLLMGLFSAQNNEALFQLEPLDATTIQIITMLIIKRSLQWDVGQATEKCWPFLLTCFLLLPPPRERHFFTISSQRWLSSLLFGSAGSTIA